MATSIKFTPIPTKDAKAWWDGGTDAYNQPLEIRTSDGLAPCRHCLKNAESGKKVLLGAYKPFASTGHFAETGPIFLCAEPCDRFEGNSNDLPPVVAEREKFMIRGYSKEEAIDYTTGQIVRVDELQDVANKIFAKKDVEFIHLRSAAYTCFTTRIDRAS